MSLASIGDRLKYVNMTDINRERRADARSPAPEPPRGRSERPGHASARAALAPVAAQDSEEHLLAYVELLFFAYRDFTGDPDSILQQLGFGRAHHRVLHFVRRYPGLRVAELLHILKITKQSLARVLRDLLAAGHIERTTGASDRRERLLFATPKGTALADRLAKPQIERIAAALSALEKPVAAQMAVASHHEAAQNFLYLMINATERDAVDQLMRRRRSPRISTLAPISDQPRTPAQSRRGIACRQG